MSRRLIALLILAVAGLTACGRATSTHPASGGYRLYLEEGYSDGGQHITVRDSATGAVERTLPIGTAAADWSRYYTVAQVSGTRRLTAIDPASGRTISRATIPTGYVLPDHGYLGPTAGLSPNGQWLALTSQGRDLAGSVTTSFMVGSSSLTDSFRTVQLNGDFAFDALSNDGQNLYLIQKMVDPNHYQVRLYQIGPAGGSLVTQPVVDKREATEPMNGIRGDSAADPTGKNIYTVYIRENGPFIHALPLDQPFAWCVDLPAKAPNAIEEQFFWSLAISPNGRSLYAANPLLGSVAVITAGEPPVITRTGQVAFLKAGNLFAGLTTDAEAKGPRIGGVALSADGRTLFAVGDTGVLAIDTSSLKVRSTILAGESVDSLRLSADGKWLYAAGAGTSKLWQLDPGTGAIHGEVKGATNPWGLLWVAPK
jgi:hypothetical protein